MKKNTSILLLLLLLISHSIYSQSFSSKFLEMKEVSYPKIPLPSNLQTFSINASDKENLGPFISDSEAASILDFKSLTYVENSPGFIINYKASEPFITKTLTPHIDKQGKKYYRFTVNTKMSINLSVTDPSNSKLIYKKQYHTRERTIDPTTGQPSTIVKQQPYELHYGVIKEVREEEVGQFFTITDDGKKFNITPSYKKEILGAQLSRLLEQAAIDLREQFDLRLSEKQQRYYVLNKIEEEPKSDELLISLQNIYNNIGSVEEYFNAKNAIQEHLEFNQSIIDKYDADDKKQAKVIWASTFNQAILLVVDKDFDKAKEYAIKAKDFNIRTEVTRLMFNDILNAKDGYKRVFNEDGTKREVEPPFIGVVKIEEQNISTIENKDKVASIKEVKIDKLSGKVFNEKGELEYEGTLYIEFVGNKMKKVYDLDTQQTTEEPSTDYGKELLVAYEKKGKMKGEKIKAKDLYSFTINDTNEKYESFATEKDALEKLMSMATLGAGNHKFYLLLEDLDKVKIYEDRTTAFDGFVLKLSKEEKGIKIARKMESPKFISKMSDFYKKRKELAERIKNGEFENTLEGHKKMGEIYNTCFKK